MVLAELNSFNSKFVFIQFLRESAESVRLAESFVVNSAPIKEARQLCVGSTP